MSFFIALIEATDASRRELEAEPKIHSMIHHGLSLAEYRAFLHDLYHIVWHFCPIMSAAASRCDDRFRSVRYELYERIEEEKGHEEWVLDDIRALGGDLEAAHARPPSLRGHVSLDFSDPAKTALSVRALGDEKAVAKHFAAVSTNIEGATEFGIDAANVFITLSARRLNGQIEIIARGELPSTESKLVQAGANRVVLPTHIGAERIAEMILYP